MMEVVGWEGLGVSVECLLHLWFFWTHIQVTLVGKANCCTLQSQDLLLQEQLYNHLGMFIIVFRCDGVSLSSSAVIFLLSYLVFSELIVSGVNL